MHTTGSPVLNWELGPVEDGGLMGARVPLTSGETIQLGRTCTSSAKGSSEQVILDFIIGRRGQPRLQVRANKTVYVLKQE
eukprot:CAMPEP_0198207782 /NCGR_PEP_ID=MMETSP1445-20131203/11207_1 /TAXON_ID=36898 /ORGANISM="Pyramimonas sp., Strain CCMP2087" /LENGTH=79 /DNA_ID=CAMNT_0043880933 /DNA_START=99 /DNA_END=335 /DNA_ORIENTATION=-